MWGGVMQHAIFAHSFIGMPAPPVRCRTLNRNKRNTYMIKLQRQYPVKISAENPFHQPRQPVVCRQSSRLNQHVGEKKAFEVKTDF